MNPPRIENSDRGITFNKSSLTLVIGFISAIVIPSVGLLFWGGTTLQGLKSNDDAVVIAITGLAEDITEARALREKEAVKAQADRDRERNEDRADRAELEARQRASELAIAAINQWRDSTTMILQETQENSRAARRSAEANEQLLRQLLQQPAPPVTPPQTWQKP